jgi:enamine deaminase RidA (YjgF/YER057c/UK114 family)
MKGKTLVALACLVAGNMSMADVPVPDYFLLRPDVERAYGYAHAVKVGSTVKISGAVSMDEEGNPTAIGDMRQQMINVYGDLAKILAHYGLSFADVIAENVFTTDMSAFLEVSGDYRRELYEGRFPTGSWLEVKGLALPQFLIEIELEAYSPR